ncbi:MAG: hypothetical protein KUG73_11525 [Pseudomonadales bacterium]|nr:hypothetical protein [Pseudomonadales bacterium]
MTRTYDSGFELRLHQALTLKQLALSAKQSNDYLKAYALMTEAHDLVVDCPKQHALMHDELRHINWKIKNHGELMGDCFLAVFRPLGIFEVLAYALKRQIISDDRCRR